MEQNLNPAFDLPDIQQDIPYIQGLETKPVNWRWYQEGYDLESTDTNGVASHESYVSHHKGPQYFGYLANTPPLRPNFRGMTDFFTDMAEQRSAPRRRVLHPRRLHEPNGAVAADHQPALHRRMKSRRLTRRRPATTTTRVTPTGRSARRWRPA